MPYDPLDAENDTFRPTAISTLVGCLHCGEEYDSYRIEWRVETDHNGRAHGFWCCPYQTATDEDSGLTFFLSIPTTEMKTATRYGSMKARRIRMIRTMNSIWAMAMATTTAAMNL